MPSKALLRPIELTSEARRVPGVTVGDLDPAAVLARRDEVIAYLDDTGHLPWLEERGVQLVPGHGRLAGERRGVAGDESLVARRAVVVATGSKPLLPPIPGLLAAHPWTNVEATTAKIAPARLAVLGGGVVGVEMAQDSSALGLGGDNGPPWPAADQRQEEFGSEQVAAGLQASGRRDSPR